MATIILPVPDKALLGYEEGRLPNFGLVPCLPQNVYGLFIQTLHLPLVIQDRNGSCWTLNTRL